MMMAGVHANCQTPSGTCLTNRSARAIAWARLATGPVAQLWIRSSPVSCLFWFKFNQLRLCGRISYYTHTHLHTDTVTGPVVCIEMIYLKITRLSLQTNMLRNSELAVSMRTTMMKTRRRSIWWTRLAYKSPHTSVDDSVATWETWGGLVLFKF